MTKLTEEHVLELAKSYSGENFKKENPVASAHAARYGYLAKLNKALKKK